MKSSGTESRTPPLLLKDITWLDEKHLYRTNVNDSTLEQLANPDYDILMPEIEEGTVFDWAGSVQRRSRPVIRTEHQTTDISEYIDSRLPEIRTSGESGQGVFIPVNLNNSHWIGFSVMHEGAGYTLTCYDNAPVYADKAKNTVIAETISALENKTESHVAFASSEAFACRNYNQSACGHVIATLQALHGIAGNNHECNRLISGFDTVYQEDYTHFFDMYQRLSTFCASIQEAALENVNGAKQMRSKWPEHLAGINPGFTKETLFPRSAPADSKEEEQLQRIKNETQVMIDENRSPLSPAVHDYPDVYSYAAAGMTYVAMNQGASINIDPVTTANPAFLLAMQQQPLYQDMLEKLDNVVGLEPPVIRGLVNGRLATRETAAQQAGDPELIDPYKYISYVRQQADEGKAGRA